MKLVMPTKTEIGLMLFIFSCLVWIAIMTLVQLPEQARVSNPCPCKPEIKGRQLYASICQSSSIKGPVLQECLYR